MKKIICLLLAVAVLFTMSAWVMAEEDNGPELPEGFVAADGARGVIAEDDGPELPEGFVAADGARDVEDNGPELPEGFVAADGAREDGEDAAVLDKVVLNGVWKEYSDNRILLTDAERNDFAVNISEITVVVNENAEPVDAASVEAGKKAVIIASAMTTFSLPPQSFGYAVMVWENEENPLPVYVDVAGVEVDNGVYKFTSADGNYIVTAGEETEVTPYITKNIIKAEDIKEGSRLLVYSDIMGLSLPAVLNATKIVVLDIPVEVLDEGLLEDNAEITKVVAGDKELNVTIVVTDGGIVMLPVRDVCEALGYEVAWDEGLQAVAVGTVPMGVNFNIGANSYNKAKMAATVLAEAPTLIKVEECEYEKTYVPSGFFSEILEAEVSVSGGAIVIK